ncbi:hypothetical protein NDU88_007749 [Pleurodeles waltl]|uniref:Uncharacterized protein n=1 Tax=Pleurodeles waltl TaxID=8319 RepID=A0AAV7STU4_PLEWA|nr:hypothetical protein NDU88_007749 [Pleurodeles waltl]
MARVTPPPWSRAAARPDGTQELSRSTAKRHPGAEPQHGQRAPRAEPQHGQRAPRAEPGLTQSRGITKPTVKPMYLIPASAGQAQYDSGFPNRLREGPLSPRAPLISESAALGSPDGKAPGLTCEDRLRRVRRRWPGMQLGRAQRMTLMLHSRRNRSGLRIQGEHFR